MNYDCPSCNKTLRWYKIISNEAGVAVCPRCGVRIYALSKPRFLGLIAVGMAMAVTIALAMFFLGAHPIVSFLIGCAVVVGYLFYQNSKEPQKKMWALAERDVNKVNTTDVSPTD